MSATDALPLHGGNVGATGYPVEQIWPGVRLHLACWNWLTKCLRFKRQFTFMLGKIRRSDLSNVLASNEKLESSPPGAVFPPWQRWLSLSGCLCSVWFPSSLRSCLSLQAELGASCHRSCLTQFSHLAPFSYEASGLCLLEGLDAPVELSVGQNTTRGRPSGRMSPLKTNGIKAKPQSLLQENANLPQRGELAQLTSVCP